MKNKINFKLKTINSRLFLIVLIAGAVIIGVSYAYFASVVSNPSDTEINLGSGLIDQLYFTPGTPLTISADENNFGAGEGSLVSGTTSVAKLVASEDGKLISMNYDVILDISSNSFIYSISSDTPEILLRVTDPGGNELTAVNGLTYKTVVDENGESYKGFDITTSTGRIKIVASKAISTSTMIGISENWKLEIIFVNHPENQNGNSNKSLTATFSLKEAEELQTENFNDYIISLHNGLDGTNSLYYTNTSEYRYSGNTPNNYVIFNNEMWRVVGVFDENSHGINSTNLVKIVRDDYIGIYKLDTGNDNSWSDSSGGAELNQLLNNHYYSSTVATTGLAGCTDEETKLCNFETVGIKESARAMIQEVTWYLGSDTAYPFQNTQVMYAAERGTSVSADTNTTTTGHIGLLYTSDYGYSALPSHWNTGLLDYASAKNDLWLSKEVNEWLITSHPGNTSYNFFVADTAGLFVIDANTEVFTRPTLYLKSTTKIVSGTGTQYDPYVISQ